MSDVLAERFAVLEDTTDTSDWPDVAQRVHWRRRQLIPPLVLIAAAMLAGSAFAAHSAGWIFTKPPKLPPVLVPGRTAVTVEGRLYTINTFYLQGDGKTCLTVVRGRSNLIADSCFSWPLAGHPFHAQVRRVGDKRIWFGLAPSGTAHLQLAGDQTIFDTWPVSVGPVVWIVAVPAWFHTHTISGYSFKGKLLARQVLY
jgi:hypothetical protein